MAAPKVPRAVIGMDKDNVPEVLEGSENSQGKFAANAALFGGAPVSATVWASQNTDLSTKHQATKTNKGAIGTRDAALDTVWVTLETNCAFVNTLVHQQPAQGVSIIEQSGFQIHKVGYHAKQLVELFATTNPGEVRVEANASMLLPPSGKKHTRKTWLFRHSLDGGKTWITDDSEPVARTLLKGLPAQVEIQVQVAVKDSKGQSAWTQSFTITLLK